MDSSRCHFIIMLTNVKIMQSGCSPSPSVMCQILCHNINANTHNYSYTAYIYMWKIIPGFLSAGYTYQMDNMTWIYEYLMHL